jgi:hypothetical protein
VVAVVETTAVELVLEEVVADRLEGLVLVEIMEAQVAEDSTTAISSAWAVLQEELAPVLAVMPVNQDSMAR